MHFFTAFIACSAAVVYYVVSTRLVILRQRVIVPGAVFGILVYLFMNLVVLPLSAVTLRAVIPAHGARRRVPVSCWSASLLQQACVAYGRAYEDKEHVMDIERIGKTNRAPGVPVISFAAVHGSVVYLCGVTANPAGPLGDVKQQTREVLGQIDRLLTSAGTESPSS